MPTYNYKIKDSVPIYLRPDLRDRWLSKHESEWFAESLTALGISKDPKTAEQLGYYWGLLVPEIVLELERQEHTYTLTFGDFVEEVYYDKYTAHELLTVVCGRVGDNGTKIRVSEMSLHQMMRFIDNVLNFAEVQLSMKRRELEAWRPAAAIFIEEIIDAVG